MANIGLESIDINKKYPINFRIQNIIQFIQDNSNQDGVDLENIYVGRLNYIKSELNKDEDKNFANRVIIVYPVTNLENDTLYMDLFKKRLYEKTAYVIPGVLSFAPFTREGLTISEVFKLSELLNLERMQIGEIEEFYKKIENISYEDFLVMFNDQIMASLDYGLKREIKKEE